MRTRFRLLGFVSLAILSCGVGAGIVASGAVASGASVDTQTGLSTVLNCPTDYFEMADVLTDGTVDSNPMAPVDRVQAMLAAGFLDVQGNPVVIDDSRLDGSGGIVVVGTNAAGTLATVNFSYDSTYGWQVTQVTRCA